MNIAEKDKKYVAGTYNRFPLTITHGKGSLCYDEAGNEYIDLGTGIGVNAFGFSDEVWQKAVEDQLPLLQHTSNLYYTKPCADLAEMLCLRTKMSKVFFSNSGAEANECAIKAARKWAESRSENDNGGQDAVIVTLVNSFHGRTLGTLAATGQEHYHEHFQPLPEGFMSVPAEDAEALSSIPDDLDVAAVMFECIQGEGGVKVLSAEYVEALSQFASSRNALIIVDEVQSGNGRTGKLYSYMHYDLDPDIVTTAKGLAGGLPIGATLLSERVQDVLAPGDHGSTFGGNPISCAAALSIMSRIDQKLMDEVEEKSDLIRDTLSGAPGIRSVSGRGLMIGIEVEKKAADIVSECLKNGVLALTANDRVRLLPALNIPRDVLKKGLDVIVDACKA